MTQLNDRYVNDLQGKHFVVYGWKADWPGYLLPTGLNAHLTARGAIIQKVPDDLTDYVFFGPGREKGRAKAMRKYEALNEKGLDIELLNVPALLHLLRPDINGLRFAFAGGFSHGAAALESGPDGLLARYGAVAVETITPDVDYLIVGERRAKGKTAALRQVEQLNQAGAQIQTMAEQPYLDMLSIMDKPGDATLDFSAFVVQLRGLVDPRRLDRAIKMLKKEAFNIYADVEDNTVSGIIKSQSSSTGYYASWLRNDGSYCCYNHELEECMGLQGSICKHILVLLMGLSCNGDLKPETALAWATSGSDKPPKENEEDPAVQMLLRYKSVEAGEIDWRPTETVPEDYYIL